MIVTAAVLGSAVLHACWNALAHRSGDPTAAVVLIHTGLGLVTLPLLLVVPPPAAAARPYLAATLVLHLGYVLLLARSYRLGDFGQVYPLARGSAPLLVALVAVLVVDEPMSGLALLGVVVVCSGLFVLVGAGWRRGVESGRGAHDPRAVLAAMLTGLFIAGYTTVDGLGVRQAGGALSYTVWLFALHGATVFGYGLLAYRRSLPAVLRDGWRTMVGGGAAGGLSYALVLWAQTRGSLAAVAALRETSVVAAAVIGTVFFGERFGRRRIAATVLVAVGIVLLNL